MAKYISSVRREDFQDYEGYLQALHRSGEPVPDHVLCGSGGGFRGELLRGIYGHQKFGDTVMAADSDEVARVYRYEVARGFRDDVAHLSDLISPGGEAF